MTGSAKLDHLVIMANTLDEGAMWKFGRELFAGMVPPAWRRHRCD